MDQRQVERTVFREFAAASPLAIDNDTIENRDPPEPDIVCEIDNHGVVGFELTELIDRGFMARTDLMAKTQEHLAQTWKTKLPVRETQEFQRKYSDTLLHFVFGSNARRRQREGCILEILHALVCLPDGFEGVTLQNDPNFLPVLEEVRIGRGQLTGPILDVDSGGWLGDPTESAINNKLSKTYECSYPIELVAYIDLNLLPPEAAWMSAADDAAGKLSESQFERIWVFDRSSQSVKYEKSRS